MNLPYAEDVNYFKTGKSSPDTWIERAKKEIETAGGKWIGDAFGNDVATGRAAFMVQFELQRSFFKICWPVLPSENGNERAARIQAATMLYHDIKSKCVSAKVKGARQSFFEYLLLSDGRTVAQIADDELLKALPSIFQKAIISGKEN